MRRLIWTLLACLGLVVLGILVVTEVEDYRYRERMMELGRGFQKPAIRSAGKVDAGERLPDGGSASVR